MYRRKLRSVLKPQKKTIAAECFSILSRTRPLGIVRSHERRIHKSVSCKGANELLEAAEKKGVKNRESGITLIETLMAAVILLVGSLSMVTLLIGSIATNSRNKMDSTQAMLATSILEQINSTFVGAGTSTLVDCAGNTWTINTGTPSDGSSGAALNGANINYSEASPPSGYFMNYVVNTPCTSTGTRQGTYDVRWHVDAVGGVGVTNTYLLTVGARLKNHGEGNQLFSAPVTLRVMSGN